MGRSAEAYQEQQEQENESCSDDYEAWIASMENKETVPQVIAETDCTTELCLIKH